MIKPKNKILRGLIGSVRSFLATMILILILLFIMSMIGQMFPSSEEKYIEGNAFSEIIVDGIVSEMFRREDGQFILILNGIRADGSHDIREIAVSQQMFEIIEIGDRLQKEPGKDWRDDWIYRAENKSQKKHKRR